MPLSATGHVLIIWMRFFEQVTELIGKGRALNVVYVDFSKVFGEVPHGMVLFWLEFCEQ